MNFAGLREAVRTRCGLSVNDARYAEVDDRINEALHGLEVAAPGGWDWLRVSGTCDTVADQGYLGFDTLASALGAIDGAGGIRAIVDPVKAAYGAGYDNLRREQKQDLDDAFGVVDSSSSTLQFYAVEQQRVWLYPTPASAVSLAYTVIVFEPDLVADDETPRMPSAYHRVLVSAASDLMLQSLQRFGDAKVQQDAAERGLARMFSAARPVTGAGRISSATRR